MKKPLSVSPIKKKSKASGKPKTKSTISKIVSKNETRADDLRALISQVRTEILEKIDIKINALNHRFDRLENGIEEILDELRETEALMESESEPYEGQA